MDGRSFKNKIKPSAKTAEKTEEVIFLNEFIFDLQRFDELATKFKLTKDTTEGNDGNTWLLEADDSSGKEDLGALINAADIPANATIKLATNIQTTTAVQISKDLTIDLDGHTWTSAIVEDDNDEEYAIEVTGRTLNIVNTKSGSSPAIAIAEETTTGSGEEAETKNYNTKTALIGLTGGSLIVGSNVTLGDDTNTKVPLVEVGADSTLNVSEATLNRANATGETDPPYIKNNSGNSNAVQQSGLAPIMMDGVPTFYASGTQATNIAVAQIGNDKYYSSLAAAFSAAQDGDTISLVQDITLEATADAIELTAGNGNVTLNLNGHTIKKVTTTTTGAEDAEEGTQATTTYTYGSEIFSITGGSLTLEGSGNIIGKGGVTNFDTTNNASAQNTGQYYYSQDNKGLVTVNGGSLVVNSASVKVMATDGVAVYANNATVEVKSGEITSGLYNVEGTAPAKYSKVATVSDFAGYKVGQGINAENGSVVKISGGTVETSYDLAYNTNEDYSSNTSRYFKASQAVFARCSEVEVSGSANIKGYEGVFVVGNGIEGSAKLSVSGGTIEGSGSGVRNRSNTGESSPGTAMTSTDRNNANGWRNEGGTYISVTGGTIKATGTDVTNKDNGRGMFLGGANSTTIIDGGTVQGTCEGVMLRAGSLEVKSGTVEVAGDGATKIFKTVAPTQNSSSIIGAGIAVSQHVTQKDTNVVISGGTVKGPVGVAVANTENLAATVPAPTITIKGGTITGDAEVDLDGTEEGTATTKYAVNNADSRVALNIEGGTFSGAFGTNIGAINNEGEITEGIPQSSGDPISQAGGTFNVAQETNLSSITDTTDAKNLTVTKKTLGITAAVEDDSTTEEDETQAASSAQISDSGIYTYKKAGSSVTAAAVVTKSDGSKVYIDSFSSTDYTAATGDKITLLRDVTDFAGLDIGTNTITLDLAGHKITSTVATAFTVTTGTFTLEDSAANSQGSGSVEIASSVNTKGSLVSITGAGTFNMTGGKLDSKYTLVETTSNATDDTAVKITGAYTTLNMKSTNAGDTTPYALNIAKGTLKIGEQGVINSGSTAGEEGTNIPTSTLFGPKIIVESANQGIDFSTGGFAAAINFAGTTANVNYAEIDVKAESGIVRAINMAGTTLNFKGGKITADGSDSNYDVGIYQAKGAVNITGGNILGEDYGIYKGAAGTTFTVNETDGQTTITGTEVGAVARSLASGVSGDFQLGVGVEFYGASGNILANASSFYQTVASGVTGIYGFSQQTLTAGSNNSWNFQYGVADTTSYTPGYISSVYSAAATGNLLTQESLGLVDWTGNVSGTNRTFTFNSDAGLNLVEGASLEGAGLEKGNLTEAGTYRETAKLAEMTADADKTLKLYEYKGVGADQDGFTYTEGTNGKLVYHEESKDKFTLQSGLNFAEAAGDQTADGLATQMAAAFTVTSAVEDDETIKTLTLIHPDSIFAASGQTDGNGLWLYGDSDKAYKLAVGDDVKVSLKENSSFEKATLQSGTDASPVYTPVWQYMAAGGAVNATGGAAAGYMAEAESLNRITYRDAALTFGFKEGDSTAVKFNDEAGVEVDSKFTLTSATNEGVTTKTLTIGRNALAAMTDQTDGATLGFFDKPTTTGVTYSLAFGDGVVTVSNEYNDTADIATNGTSTTINNYLYTGTGLATQGYRYINGEDNNDNTAYDGTPTLDDSDITSAIEKATLAAQQALTGSEELSDEDKNRIANEVKATLKAGYQKATEYIAFTNKKPEISLTGSAAFVNMVTEDDTEAAQYFDLNGSVLTFKSDKIFADGTLVEGASIGVASDQQQNYSLALKLATLGSQTATDYENLFTLAGGINSSQSYAKDDRLFTGVGASLAGWEASTGSALTYHQIYDQFKFATVAAGGKDLGDYITSEADFAKAVTIVAGASDSDVRTIQISASAFGDTTAIADGAAFSLSTTDSYKFRDTTGTGKTSAARYNLQLADMEAIGNYVDTNAFTKDGDKANWISKGAVGNAGFQIESDATNDAITFREAQKRVAFTVSAGDAGLLATNNQDVANAISANGSILAVSISAFNKEAMNPADGEFKFGLNGDDATKYSISLGGGYNAGNQALGDLHSVESFTGGVYYGKGMGGQNRQAGYKLVDNDKALAYYNVADNFTLGGSATYNAFDSSASVISDFFDVTAGATAVTIKPGAINEASFAQGTTMSISGSFMDGTSSKNYTLVLGAGVASANNAQDTIKVVNGTNQLQYTGVGAEKLGFAASNAQNTLFTYYDQYKQFDLASKNVTFQTTVLGAGNGANVAKAAAASVQAILDKAFTFSGDGDSVVTINDLSIFNFTASDGSATIAQASADKKYSVEVGSDISLAAVVAAPTLTGSGEAVNNVYTYNYSSIGADKQGLYNNSTVKAYQFYEKAETFDLTSNIALDLGSVNAKIAETTTQNNDRFRVDVEKHQLFIGKDAFSTQALSELKEGDGITIGSSGLNDTVPYGLVLNLPTGNLVAGYENFASAQMNPFNTFTSVTAAQNPNNTIVGEYKFAGAEANGFVTIASAISPTVASSLLFHEKADRFTLVGSLGLSKTASNNAYNNDYIVAEQGNSIVSFNMFEWKDVFDENDLKTGATLSIANPDTSIQATQYKLGLGNLPEATDAQLYDSLTAGEDAKTYSYKGKGSKDAAGVIVSDEGLLTFYQKRDIDFNLYSDIALNTTLNASAIGGDDANIYYGDVMTVSGSNANYRVTIGAGAFDSTQLVQGNVISLGAGANSTYRLSFDPKAYTQLTGVNDAATITSNTYAGIGASVAGFYQKDSATASFTFYDQYNSFTLQSGNNLIGFNTSLTADELNSAVTVTGHTANSSKISIGSTDLFNPNQLKTGNKLQLAQGSYAIYSNPVFVNNLALAQTDINAKDTLTATGDNAYTYTFQGATREGFLAGGNNDFTYYAQSDTLGIESDIAFNLASISAGLATFDASHSVGATGNMITISAGALDMANATVGAVITVGKNGNDTYGFVLGDGLTGQTVAADWLRNTNANIAYFREAGYGDNAFTGAGTSELTYQAPSDHVTLAASNISRLTNDKTNAAKNIYIDDTTKVVSISSGLLTSAFTVGESLGLASGSGALGYTLDLSAFESDTNVYYSQASINTGEGTATYIGTGMSSTSGYHVYGDGSLRAMTYEGAASVVGFNTTGGITLSDAADAAKYVTVTAGTGNTKYVSIGAGALTDGTLFSAAKLSLDAASWTAGYRLALGGDLTVAGAYQNAALDPTTKIFTSEGAKTAGYAIDGNALTYYDESKTIRFTGNLNFTNAGAAQYIKLNGNNVIVSDAAFALSTLTAAGANASIQIFGNNDYKFSFDSLTSAGTLQAAPDIVNNRTYVGIGSEQDGFFKNDDKTAVYWKEHDSFTFTDQSDLEFANGAAALITVTAGTGNTKIIAMTGDAFTGQTNGSLIRLNDAAIAKGYQLSWNHGDSLTSVTANVAANVNTLTGVYTAFGASQSGYLLSDDKAELTYYEKAESFPFVMIDGDSASLMPWNTSLSAEDLGKRIRVATNKEVRFTENNVLNTSNLKGDGTEVFSIAADNYKLVTGSWSEVTASDITDGSFDADSKKLVGAGANINAAEGLMQDGNAVKYYRKAAEVTLGGTAEFEAIPDDGKIADYFTIVGKKVSLKDKALDVITNEAEGVSLTATGSDGTAYTLELADTLKGVGSFVNKAAWSGNTSKTYTGIGLSSAPGAAKAGFLGDGSTVATYHEVADTIKFAGGIDFVSNSDNVLGNITISAVEGDGTIKTVTLGQNALNPSQKEGASLKVETDGYVLNTAISDDGTMIGGLNFGGEYTASVTFAALGEDKVWTYRGIGADRNGYIVGEGADSLTLTYHTVRGAQFEVAGNVEYNSALSSIEAAAYFTVPGGTGARTVTVGKDLFASTQADGATIMSATDGYTLTMAAADRVSMLGGASFDTTTATYIEGGANKDGFTVEDGGILQFHKQGANFKFVNESVVSGSDTIYAVQFDGKANADMFTLTKDQDGAFIQIAASALSTQQIDGAQLRLDADSQAKGYKLTLGNLIDSSNTYSDKATFTANADGGGVYTTAGMANKAGYVQGADETVLVYHDQATSLTFTGTLKFNELTAGTDISNYFLVNTTDHAVTINGAALASIQDSGASLSASDGNAAYKLVLGSGVTSVTGSYSGATFNNTSKVFNSEGFTTAGYKVGIGNNSNSTVISYYDSSEKVSFTQSDVTFTNNVNTVANNIKITKDGNDKIVTVGIGAINTTASALSDGMQLIINETNKYKLAVDDALSGGTYDPDIAFAQKDSVGTATDGTTIYKYTYKYGGADKNGFVKTSASDDFFTYKTKGTTDPIEFEGDLNFNENMSAADRAKFFGIDTTNKTVTLGETALTGNLFGENADQYYLKPTTSGYKMVLADDFTLKAGGNMEDSAVLAKDISNNTYTYTGTGADTVGYMTTTDGQLVYRGPIERATFAGNIALNTDSVDALKIEDGVITIGKDLLASQSSDATLTLTSYSVGGETLKGTFALGDSIDAWTESEASLTNYNRTYTTAGVSKEGYSVVGGDAINYRAKSTDELTFTGLNSNAKASDLTLQGGLFTIGNNALNELNISVSGGTGSYTLAVAGADTNGVYIPEGKDSVAASLSEDKKTYTTFKTAETYTGNGTAAITYASAVGGEAISFTGLGSGASIDNVLLEGTAFTVGAAALDTVNVSVDKEGYTLTLTGVQLETPDSTVEAATFGSVSGGVAEYARDTLFSEYWTAQGTNAYNYNKAEIATEGLFTLSGVSAVEDSIVGSDNKVTLAKSNVATNAAELTLTNSTGNTYTLALASDLPTEASVTATDTLFGAISGDTVAFSQYSTIGSYWNKVSGSEAYTLVAETEGTPVELFTLKGIKSVAESMVSGQTVTMAKDNVADNADSFALTNSAGNNYSLALASDLPTAATEIGSMTAFSAVTNNEAVFSKTSTLSSFWAKEDNTETYNFTPESVQAGQGLFTLSGVSAVDNDMVDGTNVEIAAANMVDSVTAVNLTGDNYTLVLGEGLTASSVKAKAYDASSMTFNTAGNTEGYTIVGGGKTINHVNSSVDEFKFTGLNDKAATKYFTPNADDKTIMVHADATKTDGTPVSLTAAPSGYKLAFGSSMTRKASETYTKNYDADTMTYTTAGQTEGYVLADDAMSINYITADKATGMAFKFTGLNDKAATKYFTPDTKAKTIMVHADATKTDGTTLKLTSAPSGYKLAFGSSMTREASETYKKEYDSKTMTYTTAGQTQGYVLASDGMSIDYITAAKATGLKFTFTGLNDKAATKYFTPDTKAKTIMVHADATKTDGTTLKLTSAPSGYKLAFGSSMTREASETYTKNYDADTMTYTTAGQTQGYVLASDGMSINYITAAKATGMAFKFTGLTSKAATKHFTVNSNKTIMVHADAAPTTDGAVIKLTDAPTGYKLAFGSSMTKKAATTGGTLSGTTYTYGQKAGYTLSSDAMSITYSKADTKLKLTGVASKVSDPASNGTVSLKLANFGSNLAISSNTGKYKFSVASGTYTGKKLTGSTGADTITSAGASLTVNLGKGNDSLVSTGANVTVTAGAGNDYVKATGTRSVVNGGDGKDTILGGSGNDKFYGGAGNDSINGGAGKDSLRGDAGADVLLGGAGNDSLWGGAGNDSLYGGAGNDTFIYRPNEGTDTIFDYASGDLVKIVNSSGKNVGYTNATFSGGNLTLAVSGGGSLVLRSMSVGDKVNINGKSHTITNSGLN